MVFTVLFIAAPDSLAAIYTNDISLLQLTALLLPIAGVFQVFDGLQVVSIGLLRGLGDTRVPVFASILGFWCFGIPISLFLGFVLEYGAVGLWWGLVAGLFVVAASAHSPQAARAQRLAATGNRYRTGSLSEGGLAGNETRVALSQTLGY